jgi:hypothetical protein
MAQTAIRTDLDQTADILGNLAPQVAFNTEVILNVRRERVNLILSDVVGLLDRIDIASRQNVISAFWPDTVDVSEGEADLLLARDIHTHHSRHICFTSLSLLTLTLFVARVGTDHAHHAFAADDAAVLANATNGTTYFHGCYFTLWSGRMKGYYIILLT